MTTPTQTPTPENDTPSPLVAHAIRELRLLREAHPGDELIITPFEESVLGVVEAFAESGQSGGSAPYTAAVITSVLKKMLAYEPLSPITGAEDEWERVEMPRMEPYIGPLWQNRRDHRVFKSGSGKITFSAALRWVDSESGDMFTGSVSGFSSTQEIHLPCDPETREVSVTRIETDDPDDWQYRITSEAEEAELASLFERGTP